ncbi:MAG TPA: hypothetical protein VMU59_01190 [Caulobacteraceae bacterium]|nr:hypothetical protein [Caulobacteraceae bacterium]
MSRLLIAGFGAFPQAPDNPAAAVVRRLRDEGWTPPGAQALYAILPTTWAGAAPAVLDVAEDAAAILLIGVAVGAPGFRVETRARNRASPTHPDAEGQTWSGDLIDPSGPAERRTAVPALALRDAITQAGQPIALSDDAGDYLCNFTFYRVLAARPTTAFLHVPALGDGFTLDDLTAAARAAAAALTSHPG